MCQADQKVGVAVQEGRCGKAGNMGNDAGKKKRKAVPPGMAPSFRIFWRLMAKRRRRLSVSVMKL
jgi:hypothetical protein